MFCPDCTTYKRGARRTLFSLSTHKILVYFIGQNAFGVFWTGERLSISNILLLLAAEEQGNSVLFIFINFFDIRVK
jgi:hypothetical protein